MSSKLKIECRGCGAESEVSPPGSSSTVHCPECGKPVTIGESERKASSGRFVWDEQGTSLSSLPLTEGIYTIGAKSSRSPSDIEVNDQFASRRSMELAVTKSGNRLIYDLKLLKTTNPVSHNRRVLTPGEVVRLQFGDILTIGMTNLYFQTT